MKPADPAGRQPPHGEPGGEVVTAGARVVVRELAVRHPDSGSRIPVIRGINLDLDPGRCLAVVGESGCGKTTLLHALAGLLRPEGGEVLVDNQVVSSPAGAMMCRHAAYLFQQDLLLPWKTAVANAAFAARVARPAIVSPAGAEARAESLLREFGLEDALQFLPHQLSGGMRKRVALARTLVLDRSLVLLDEPFAALDALTRADLQRWLLSVMQSHPATWVLVTHDINEAVLVADRVVVLGGRPGTIVGCVDVPVGRSRKLGGAHDALADGLLRRAASQTQALLSAARSG